MNRTRRIGPKIFVPFRTIDKDSGGSVSLWEMYACLGGYVLFWDSRILSQRECVGMISACADELRQACDHWQECTCGQVEGCAGGKVISGASC